MGSLLNSAICAYVNSQAIFMESKIIFLVLPIPSRMILDTEMSWTCLPGKETRAYTLERQNLFYCVPNLNTYGARTLGRITENSNQIRKYAAIKRLTPCSLIYSYLSICN